MNMAAENISSLLDVLPNTNDPVSSLLELKGVLCSVHPTTLSEVVPSLSFHVVFEFLNSQKRQVSVHLSAKQQSHVNCYV